MTALDWFVLAVYASLVLELVAFPIASEASTYQLLTDDGADAAAHELRRARGRHLLIKVLLFALPTVVGVLFYLLPLVVVMLGDVPTGSPRVDAWLHTADSAWRLWTGIALVVIGRALTFASVLQLRRSSRGGAGVPSGAFRWSRNPGLCGMFACYIGLALCCGVDLMWFGLPIYLVNMHQRVRIEESSLLARLGDAWREYAARVPRYLPLPGLR